MKNIFFTPGPSQIYPTLGMHFDDALTENIPSISHRGPGFMNLFGETVFNLRKLMGIPKSHKIYFLSSATECMERILESCVYRKSYHFVNGAFSGLFYKTASKLNLQTVLREAEPGSSFDFSREYLPKSAELVCLTHNETSTGVSLDLGEVGVFVKNNSNKLFALDVVSSAPYVKIDFKLFDLVFFSVQKGFGLPAGLGVLIVSPKAFEKAGKLLNKKNAKRSYHDILNLEKYALMNQTPETPNVMNIFLLNRVVKDMIKYGAGRIIKETEIKSELIYNCFDRSNYLKTFVKSEKDRSRTVCVADTVIDSEIILSKLKDKGFVIGGGYKEMRNVQVRIANFPAHSVESVRRLVKELDLV